MSTITTFLKEFEEEALITEKMLSVVPDEFYGWKPHERSMTISQLTTHIAELPSWVMIALTTEELDFAKNPYDQVLLNTTADVLKAYKKAYAEGTKALQNTSEEILNENWTMRNGDHIISVRTKAEVIRMAFSQTVHHRAQLGVFLRLLNVPIPGTYGPSADEIAAHRDYQKTEA